MQATADDTRYLAPSLAFSAREALIAFKQSIEYVQHVQGNIVCDVRNTHRLSNYIDERIGREERLRFYTWLTGHPITTTLDLTQRDGGGMLRFGAPVRIARGKWEFSLQFRMAIQGLEELYGLPETPHEESEK
jgi:hypothetical protein